MHAGPLLGAFNRAGIVSAPDVQVAQRLGRLSGETDERVLRAVALAVLEELTERQVEVVLRKLEHSLDQIAADLGISRGTVDNELRRAGETIERHAADFSREEILEKLLDVLS